MYCGGITTHTRKSGKTHICDWCGQSIEIGELYSKWLFFDSGLRSTVYAHKECSDEWMKIANDEGGIIESSRDNERPVCSEQNEQTKQKDELTAESGDGINVANKQEKDQG